MRGLSDAPVKKKLKKLGESLGSPFYKWRTMDLKLFFIKKEYYSQNNHFTKMLDPGKFDKQSQRIYICIKVSINENDFFIPLRNNLGEGVRKFGRIGHQIPSNSRPLAGLDFRYSLIVNDKKFIEAHNERIIPQKQYRKITKEFDEIQKEFEIYLSGFIKALKKNRVQKEPLYRESSLINFSDILSSEFSNNS